MREREERRNNNNEIIGDVQVYFGESCHIIQATDRSTGRQRKQEREKNGRGSKLKLKADICYIM